MGFHSASELLSYIEYALKTWGVFIVPVGAFLENSVILSFIFPGVTVIFLSGFVQRTTGDGLILIIALASIGSFLGDNLDYFIGRKTGKLLETKPLFRKPIHAVKPFLYKHGTWAIFAGRFSSWSRAWIALACGTVHIPYWKFATVSALSATLWSGVWIIGGYLLGGEKELISQWLTRGALIFWLGFLVLIVYYFRTRIKLVHDLLIFSSKKYSREIINAFKKTK